jgi:hypothetical protein
VSGVGDQRHRIGEHAGDELHGDESQVQTDADGEGHAEVGGSVHMSGRVTVVAVPNVMRAILVRAVICAHRKYAKATPRAM